LQALYALQQELPTIRRILRDKMAHEKIFINTKNYQLMANLFYGKQFTSARN
jgi:hypothetical protein